MWECSMLLDTYDKNFHEWEIIPLNLFDRYLRKSFNFHFNLMVKSSLIQNFPTCYQEIFFNYYNYLSFPVSVTWAIISQFLWLNKDTLIEKQSFLFPTMSNNSFYHLGQILDNKGEIKDWEAIKLEFNLENKVYFSWMQLIKTIPVTWKRNIVNNKGNSINLCIFDCRIIKKSNLIN